MMILPSSLLGVWGGKRHTHTHTNIKLGMLLFKGYGEGQPNIDTMIPIQH